MTDIGTWTDKAERRVTMALEETIKQLEYEANALWKGKHICGVTVLGSRVDTPVSRVRVGLYQQEDGLSVEVSFYAAVPVHGGTLEMCVHNPRFPNEQTP
jgi:hypothetical protein